MTCRIKHEHNHGGSHCYNHGGCRCEPCRAGKSRITRNARRLRAYGTWEGLVPSIGTQRRIHGLQRLGFTLKQIGDSSGLVTNTVWRVLGEEVIATKTRDRIAATYSEILRTGAVGTSKRTASLARNRGYPSPYSWDDIDRDAEPVKTDRERSRHGVDPVAVEQAMNGYGGERLNTAEADEAIERLHARQWSDALIGSTIRRSEKTVLLTRQRLGLEAWPTADLVKLRERKAA